MNRFHRWYCSSDRWRTTLHDKVLPWALKDVDLGDDVLEVGPGPGLTTDVLRTRTAKLTCLEVDPAAAKSLQQRIDDNTVTVVEGDGAAMPFEDGRFTSAVCFTMLHHVPTPDLQDKLLAEVHRVLKPGATFAGSDSTASLLFKLAHLSDTMVLVDPAGFKDRLAKAGFDDVKVQAAKGAFRFRGTKH